MAAYVDATQMDADVPTGELDLEPVLFDEERVRISEARLARSYQRLVASATHGPTACSAGSPRAAAQGRELAQQFDTLVMPAHRGTGSDSSCRSTPRPAPARPPRAHRLHTWTAPVQRGDEPTNERFGFP